MKKTLSLFTSFADLLIVLGNVGGSVNQVIIVKDYDFHADTVWEPWTQVDRIANFHPGLVSSSIIGDRFSGVGACRQVTTTDGKQLIHEIVELDESDRRLGFTFAADFLPLKHAICRIHVIETGAITSKLEFSVDMQPKYGLLGWLLGKIVLEGKLKDGGDSLLGGLESYLKS